MHPAFSVIFFTVATGAGYGLLAFLGIFAAIGAVPGDRWAGGGGLAVSLGLITAGLLSSMAHLSHPERAWRAFSHWRSSWLSREGVAAVFTYGPALLFAAGWMYCGRTDGWIAVAALAAALSALGTVTCTGMIYASLKPIPQWRSPYTLPTYILLSAMTGAVLFNALASLSGNAGWVPPGIAALAIMAAWIWKSAAWRHDRMLDMASTMNSATGLRGGTVRSVEWPHTEQNYVLKQMGYKVARKHAERLRRLAHPLAFGLPLLLTVMTLPSDGLVSIVSASAAVPVQILGVLIERWLFFAEAKHTATLYYGG